MELIRVNSQKLKIILTKEDMTSFDITNENLDYSSAKTRKAIGSILEKAKEQTGFDTKNDRLYIQVFPSVDGGCEMFLTRRARLLPEPSMPGCSFFRRKSVLSFEDGYENGKYIVTSDDIDDIIALCSRMKKEGFGGSSSLYSLNGKYLLIINFKRRIPCFTKENRDCSDENNGFGFICDYCNVRYADELPEAYIKEHADVIIKNMAVETISEKFR